MVRPQVSPSFDSKLCSFQRMKTTSSVAAEAAAEATASSALLPSGCAACATCCCMRWKAANLRAACFVLSVECFNQHCSHCTVLFHFSVLSRNQCSVVELQAPLHAVCLPGCGGLQLYGMACRSKTDAQYSLLPVRPVGGLVGVPLAGDERVQADAHDAALEKCGDRRVYLGHILCTDHKALMRDDKAFPSPDDFSAQERMQRHCRSLMHLLSCCRIYTQWPSRTPAGKVPSRHSVAARLEGPTHHAMSSTNSRR